jgi:hypothetical protein
MFKAGWEKRHAKCRKDKRKKNSQAPRLFSAMAGSNHRLFYYLAGKEALGECHSLILLQSKIPLKQDFFTGAPGPLKQSTLCIKTQNHFF